MGQVTAVVVYSHPKPNDSSRQLLTATTAGLSAAGHDVEVIDLYRDNFGAALTREEWTAYTTPTPLVANDRYADLVRHADVLAFVFPMWWSGPPSILKGFFDRVLVPGVAFELADTGRVSPGLRHVRRVVVVTAAEAPGHFPHRSTRQLAHGFARSLRRSTSWRARTTVVWAGPGDSADDEKWKRFIDRVRERLGGLG